MGSEAPDFMSQLEKRSFSLAGHRTSVALELPFWQVLQVMADRQNRSLAQLIAATDRDRAPPQGLASTLRLLALESIRNAETQSGT
jgi:predicted DNA-binding ribbon-helix-helix protein